MRIPILFVVSTLEIGGAESQLVEMIRCLDDRFVPAVCCLTSGGPLIERLRHASIPVTTFRMHRPRRARGVARFLLASVQFPIDVARFVLHVRAQRPAIVHGVLMYGYVLGAVAARLTGVPVVVASRRNLSFFKRGRPLFRFAERLANRLTDRVVANCETVRQDVERPIGRRQPAVAQAHPHAL